MSGPKPIPSVDQIRANLKALRDQNAPEDVIDRYMASVGAKPVDSPPTEVAPTGGKYGAVDAAANGMLGGFASEIQAGLRSHAPSWMLGPDAKNHGTYSEELAKANAAEDAYAQDHKWANRGAEGLGMLLTAPVAGGESLAARIGGGAALGALQGAGNAPEGLGNRAKGAAFGGAVGGALGGATKYIEPIAEAIPGLNTVGRKLGLLKTPEQKADAFIAARFGQDKTALDAVQRAVATQTDKPEIVADLGGRNVQATAKRAFNSPGDAQDEAEKFLLSRGRNASGRASQNLAEAGVRPVNQYETADQLIQAQRSNSKPLWDKALNQTIHDPDLSALIESEPVLQAARAKAEATAREEATAARLGGTPELSTTDLMAPEGSLSVAKLHGMKLALDDMVKFGYVPPGGSASTKNFASKEVAKAFRSRLSQVPGYDEAAAQFSGDVGARTAFEEGTKHLSDEGAKSAYEIAKMSPGDRQMYQLGAGADVRRAADKIGPKGNVEAKLLGTDFKQKQVRAMLDDPAAYEKFAGEMAREGRMATTNNLQSGSQTFPMALENADAVSTLAKAGHAVVSPITTALHWLGDRANGLTPEVTQAVGRRMLSGQGGRAELMSGLQAIEKAGLSRPRKMAALAALLSAMGGNYMGSNVR